MPTLGAGDNLHFPDQQPPSLYQLKVIDNSRTGKYCVNKSKLEQVLPRWNNGIQEYTGPVEEEQHQHS
jgi:hypothetical protein